MLDEQSAGAWFATLLFQPCYTQRYNKFQMQILWIYNGFWNLKSIITHWSIVHFCNANTNKASCRHKIIEILLLYSESRCPKMHQKKLNMIFNIGQQFSPGWPPVEQLPTDHIHPDPEAAEVVCLFFSNYFFDFTSKRHQNFRF